MNTSLTVLAEAALALALVAAGCTSNQPFRTSYTPCDPTQPGAACAHPVIESNLDYKLGFVEFDDQGWFWDANQEQAVQEVIRQEAGIGQADSDQRVIVIVFVHGWKNNAAVDNDNVETFRTILKTLGHDLVSAEMLQTNHAAGNIKVVGVYAGWRGLSATLEPFKELSFWDRKNTAHKVGGYGAMTKLLADLENLQRDANSSLPPNAGSRMDLIVVGHSFGCAAVHSAISEIATERMEDTVLHGKPLKLFGNRVIFLNPAFEALRHYNLNQTAVSFGPYPANQRPVLSIFTSKGDWATHYFFPLGRFFSTWFEENRNPEQKRANREAVGWFQPFVTHDLIYDTNSRPPSGGAGTFKPTAKKKDPRRREQMMESLNNIHSQRRKWHPNSALAASYYFDDTILKSRGSYRPGDPFLVVSVDKKIMKDHDDIGNPVIINFLRDYILFCETYPAARSE